MIIRDLDKHLYLHSSLFFVDTTYGTNGRPKPQAPFVIHHPMSQVARVVLDILRDMIRSQQVQSSSVE